jgi:hypothetical protein
MNSPVYLPPFIFDPHVDLTLFISLNLLTSGMEMTGQGAKLALRDMLWNVSLLVVCLLALFSFKLLWILCSRRLGGINLAWIILFDLLLW